jgi:hypothetical protein
LQQTECEIDPGDAVTAVVSSASRGIGFALLALSPSGELLGFVGLDLESGLTGRAARLNCIMLPGSASITCRHCAGGAIRRP